MALRLQGALALLVALVVAAGAYAAPTIAWTVVASRPHDPTAFTQGLVSWGGVILESTGLNGASSVRRVNPRTGRVTRIRRMANDRFGEGLTVLRGRAVQLTWLDHVITTYAPTTLRPLSTVPYPFEGWGLTTNGRHLIASDGTSRLRWLNPGTMAVVRVVDVHDGPQLVPRLNELELITGVLWANVWKNDRIALIDPTSGAVRAWLNLAALRKRLGVAGDALNGIAQDPVTRLPIVTGKYWDRMFVIRLTEPIPPAA